MSAAVPAVSPLVTAAVGAARLDVCIADITTLAVDAIAIDQEFGKMSKLQAPPLGAVFGCHLDAVDLHRGELSHETETFPETLHGARRKVSDKQEYGLMEHSLQHLPNDRARQALSLKSEVALARSCSDVFWGSRKQNDERDQTRSSERLNHKRSCSPGA